MLYRPEAFEALTATEWRDAEARAAIAAIATDAEDTFDPDRLWPADEWDAWTSPLPLKSLYVGAAGVVWALDALRRRGHIEPQIDLGRASARALEAWRTEPDLPADVELPSTAPAGFLSGGSGILFVAWFTSRRGDLADALYGCVRANADSEADDVMWGAPGTLLVARGMLDATGEERWAAAWRESADALWRRRDADGLWTQRLYGDVTRGLGPPHGLVGNALSLLRGEDLLAAERRDVLEREASATLARTAVVEDGLANWPPTAGGALAGADGEVRVQWCAGAPGIVVSAARYLDEELLLAGAELVWRAGPPTAAKGAGICHGTAGNGYALLKAFARTGDELWLARARRFAVHALEQVERARAERGRGRYSLWTGDVGAALFAADCLDVRTTYPLVDAAAW